MIRDEDSIIILARVESWNKYTSSPSLLARTVDLGNRMPVYVSAAQIDSKEIHGISCGINTRKT